MKDIDKDLKKAARVLKDEYKNDSNLIAFRDVDIMSKSEKRRYIRELEKENEQLREVLKECNDYLTPNKLNQICTNSILHKKIKDVLKEA